MRVAATHIALVLPAHRRLDQQRAVVPTARHFEQLAECPARRCRVRRRVRARQHKRTVLGRCPRAHDAARDQQRQLGAHRRRLIRVAARALCRRSTPRQCDHVRHGERRHVDARTGTRHKRVIERRPDAVGADTRRSQQNAHCARRVARQRRARHHARSERHTVVVVGLVAHGQPRHARPQLAGGERIVPVAAPTTAPHSPLDVRLAALCLLGERLRRRRRDVFGNRFEHQRRLGKRSVEVTTTNKIDKLHRIVHAKVVVVGHVVLVVFDGFGFIDWTIFVVVVVDDWTIVVVAVVAHTLMIAIRLVHALGVDRVVLGRGRVEQQARTVAAISGAPLAHWCAGTIADLASNSSSSNSTRAG